MNKFAKPKPVLGTTTPPVDRRIWMMLVLICFFGYIVMKEISIPTPILIGVAGVGMIALLIAGLSSPELPFYVLVAYLPFSRMLVGDFGTEATAFNLTNVLTLWVFAAHAMRQSSKGESLFQSSPMNKMILVFALMGTVSLLRTAFTYGSWYISEFIIPLKRWLTPVFFYFLTFWVVRDKKVIKTVVVLIMAVTTVVALMAIRDYMWAAGSSFESSRIGGIAEHSNTLGAFFVYYMFLFAGFFFVYPKKLKVWLLLIPFLLCFRGIMVTFSRGAYLAFAFGSLMLAWFRNKILFALAIAYGVLAMANPMLLPAGIRYRMGQTVETSESYVIQESAVESLEASSATRIEIWKGAIEMIKQNPVWGIGYGSFPAMLPQFVNNAVGHFDAHNSYLLIGAEMGLPTLFVFLLVLLMIWYYTYWLYEKTDDLVMKAIALGFLGGLGGLLVANMFGSRMDAQQVISYFWILCALIMRGVMLERARLAPPKRKRAAA